MGTFRRRIAKLSLHSETPRILGSELWLEDALSPKVKRQSRSFTSHSITVCKREGSKALRGRDLAGLGKEVRERFVEEIRLPGDLKEK